MRRLATELCERWGLEGQRFLRCFPKAAGGDVSNERFGAATNQPAIIEGEIEFIGIGGMRLSGATIPIKTARVGLGVGDVLATLREGLDPRRTRAMLAAAPPKTGFILSTCGGICANERHQGTAYLNSRESRGGVTLALDSDGGACMWSAGRPSKVVRPRRVRDSRRSE